MSGGLQREPVPCTMATSGPKRSASSWSTSQFERLDRKLEGRLAGILGPMYEWRCTSSRSSEAGIARLQRLGRLARRAARFRSRHSLDGIEVTLAVWSEATE